LASFRVFLRKLSISRSSSKYWSIAGSIPWRSESRRGLNPEGFALDGARVGKTPTNDFERGDRALVPVLNLAQRCLGIIAH
jgi:hypothetical protein